MEDKIRQERALKIDNGFKINLLSLESDEITPEQKESIAMMMKASLERAKRIIERNQNPHLGITISKEEQDYINQFLPPDQQLNVVSE